MATHGGVRQSASSSRNSRFSPVSRFRYTIVHSPPTACTACIDSADAIAFILGPDIGVFASRRHCAAWAGLCPGNNESAGKRRSGRTRRGNTTLREVLIECAHGAARTHHCQFRGYHKALTVRRGFKRATVATAHKMLRVIFRVLTTRTPYRDPETDYEAMMVKRNAPRWIAMLKKHGIDPATWSPRMPAAA